MIGRLVGRLVSDDIDGRLLLDVSGVGYELTIPLGAVGRARSGARGDELVLSVHTHAREDALELFGFASDLERRVFRLLISISGVGPRLALSVLSALPPDELAEAVRRNDIRRLNKISGVGKKTAERLVLELKEKLAAIGMEDSSKSSEKHPAGTEDNEARLLGALTNMGYKPAEAGQAVDSLKDRIATEPVSDLLRAALSYLAK